MKPFFSIDVPLRLKSGSWLGFSLVCAALATTAACKNERNVVGGESEVASAGASRNGGFRILPQLAARDSLRFKVIYRCNDVPCGEAFQPSNEERDFFFPCGFQANLYPGGRFPPFLRVTGPAGQQKLIVRKEHREACERAQPFEKVLAEVQPKEVAQSASSSTTCRIFRTNRDDCLANEAQGCRWVTHPSGRASSSGGGECVGLFRSGTLPTGSENVQSLQSGSQSVRWAPVESYRPAAVGRNSELK